MTLLSPLQSTSWTVPGISGEHRNNLYKFRPAEERHLMGRTITSADNFRTSIILFGFSLPNSDLHCCVSGLLFYARGNSEKLRLAGHHVLKMTVVCGHIHWLARETADALCPQAGRQVISGVIMKLFRFLRHPRTKRGKPWSSVASGAHSLLYSAFQQFGLALFTYPTQGNSH